MNRLIKDILKDDGLIFLLRMAALVALLFGMVHFSDGEYQQGIYYLLLALYFRISSFERVYTNGGKYD